MFAFSFISTAASQLTIRQTSVRVVRTVLAAVAIVFAVAGLAEAKGGNGGGGGKSFAQKFFSNNPTAQKTSNNPIAFKQDNKPQKTFTMGSNGSDKCHDKCCYHHCHSYCCDYSYCGWGYCDYLDLQLIGVQMLDGGNPAQGVGPMFRVTFRNNSFASINRPFSLTLMTIADPTTAGNLPVGVRVRGIGAFQTAAVDIRMPLEALRPGLPMLQAIVDSHREIGEVNEANNVLVVKLAEVRPIATEAKTIAAPATETAPAVAMDSSTQAEIAKEPMADEQDD